MASGTGKRQRTKQCLVRLTEQEFAEISSKADKAGMASAAFLRAAALGNPGPRARRRPPADHVALRQILGHCGRIGNNLNQIAKHLHAGGALDVPELRAALNAYRAIRMTILTALGMNTGEVAFRLDGPP